MSRHIDRRAVIPAHIGHPMDRVAVTLRVMVCGPSDRPKDGKPSQEPWPDESVVTIEPSPNDDEAWERFGEVEEIKVPLAELRALIAGTS